MKWGIIVAGAASALIASQAQASLQIETTPFVSASIAQMDFETLSAPSFVANTAYAEGGVTIQYVWGDPWGNVASTGTDLGGGSYGWYAIDFGGYTSIKLSSGGAFNQIQFSAASGGSSPTALDALQYSLWLGGSEVATGATGPLAALGSGSSTYGFSGISFDEVRVRNDRHISYYDGTHQGDTLALDNIVIGNAAVSSVPEPATWALMIAAFGLVGAALRRKAHTTGVVDWAGA